MAAVFISYSRKDFYFAESLAFHLNERGISTWLDANHLAPGGDWADDINRALDEARTVLLVLTADSLRSEYVRREWQRALEQGDRLIIALFRSCKPPPELQHAKVVNFRGAFAPALRRLISQVDAEAELAPQKSSALLNRLPRVPPWVAIMTIMLFSVFLFPMFTFGDWKGLSMADEPIGLRIFSYLVLPVFFGFIIWHACFAFVRRRMGLTRLAFTLTFFTALFGLFLLGRTGGIAALTERTNAAAFHVIPSSVLISIVLIGCAALMIVILLRPADLLRWCPTGKAWDAYRRGRVMKVPDLPTRLKEVQRFQLLHDASDAPAAARLRADFLALGVTEAGADENEAKQVILLTNRTTRAWLTQRTELMQKSVLTIIGSAIDLPPSLSSLWRRQWIDLRRWDATRRRKNPVPAVPEGMKRLHLPKSVRATEHLLCAMAGLLAVLANVVLPPDTSKSDTLTPREGFGCLIAMACVFWIAVAWQLIHRKITQPRYSLWVRVPSWLTLLLAASSLYFFVSLGGNVLRTIPAVIFILVFPILSARSVTTLTFWFPAPPEPGTKFLQRLNAPRKWDALLWSFVYMALWMVLLGADA